MHDQTLLARQLEYFEVLYQKRSYSDAARAIPITHQGLRKAIDKLEADLDVTLFRQEESSSGLIPTPSADILYEYTLDWTADIKRLHDDLDRLKSQDVQTVSICSALGTLATLGYRVVSDFNAQHESLKLDFIDYSDEWVDQCLLEEEFSIGIVRAPFDGGLVTTPLKSVKSGMWVSRENPLAKRPYLTLSDLEGQNITIPEPHYKAHAFYRDEFRKRHIHPKSIMNCTDLYWSYTFAHEGLGLGMCDAEDTKLLSAYDDVVLLPLLDGFVQRIGIAYRRGHELTSQERIVHDFIIECCAGK